MKKFTGNFLLGERGLGSVLRKIGLGIIMVFWSVLSFGQEAQQTLEYYADGPTNACYNALNNYEVQVSFRDFVLIDTFSLKLTYDEDVFSYAGVVTGSVNDTLGAANLVVTESTAGTLIMKWGNGTASPVTIGDDVKTPVFKLKFTVDGFQHYYGLAAPAPFTSDLEWDDANSKFWNLTGGVQSPVVTKENFDGTLTVTESWDDVELVSTVADCDGGLTTATVVTPANVTGMEYSFNGSSFTLSDHANVTAPSTNNTVRIKLDGCISYIKNFDVQANEPFEFTADDTVYVNCPGGNGDIEVVATGGSPDYSYYIIPYSIRNTVWTALAIPSTDPVAYLAQYKVNETGQVAVIEKPAGTYYVLVQDANECGEWTMSSWQRVRVIDNKIPWIFEVTEFANVTCNGADDGQLAFTVSGATPWAEGYNVYVNGLFVGKGFGAVSNSEETSNFEIGTGTALTDLEPGNYTIVVQDSLGCMIDTVITVTEPTAIDFAVGHTDTGCEDDIAEIWIETATITGGSGSLSNWEWRYSEDPLCNDSTVTSEWFDIDETATEIGVGVYYIQVKDSMGCMQLYTNPEEDDAVKILETEYDLVISPIACNADDFDAEIVFTSGDGGHDFEFKAEKFVGIGWWGNWVTVADWQASPEFTGLSNNSFPFVGKVATLWRFTVRDNTLDCTVSYTRNVVPPTRLMATFVPYMSYPPSCPENAEGNESADGNIVIQGFGGTPFIGKNGPYYKYKMDNQEWNVAYGSNSFRTDFQDHTILVLDSVGCTYQLNWNGWNKTENVIDFQDTIENSCPHDVISLYYADEDDDTPWYIEDGYLNDFSWHGEVGSEDVFGPSTFGYYSYWTPDTTIEGYVQGAQFQRNPKLYWSSSADVETNGTLVTEETVFPAGKYYLIAIDEWGCKSNVDSIVVLDPPALDVEYTTIPAGCAGSFDGQLRLTAYNGTQVIPHSGGLFDPYDRYQYVLTQAGAIFNQPDWTEQVTWQSFTNGNIDNDSLLSTQLSAGHWYIAVRDYCSLEHPELIWFDDFVIEGADPVELVSFDKGNVTCNVADDYDEKSAQMYSTVSTDDGYFVVTGVSGGFGEGIIGNYTYTLEGTDSTMVNKTGSFTGLWADLYTLTIADDSLGCQLVYSFEITEPDPLHLEVETVNASCYGAEDGIIRYIIEGGTAPYWESTNNGQNWFKIGTAQVSGVTVFDRQAGAGTYTIMIKDSLGCTYPLDGAVEVVIDEPGLLGVDSVTVDSVSCNSLDLGTSNDGEIRLKIKGGWNMESDGFVYTATAKKGTTTVTGTQVNSDVAGWVTFSGLTAGDWEITVKESNSSLYSGPYTTNPAYATAYNYYTTIGFPSEYQNGRTTCKYTGTISVKAPDTLEYDLAIEPVQCFSEQNGSITMSNIKGGTKPYTVGLEGPDGSIYESIVWTTLTATGTSKTWSNLPHGHYNVFLKDAHNCSVQYESAEINDADSLELQMVWLADTKCNGSEDGMIKAVAAGGTGAGTYEYAVVEHTYNFVNLNLDSLDWQPSDTFYVGAGVWVGFVRDAHRCVQGYPTDDHGHVIQAHRVEVDEPTMVVGTATSGITFATGKVDCYGEATGKIHVTSISGGNGAKWKAHVYGYDFEGNEVDEYYDEVDPAVTAKSWLTGLRASTDIVTDEPDTLPDSEKYSVVFIDKLGCESDPVMVAVVQPEKFEIELYVTQDAFICHDDLAGIFEIRVISGGVEPIQYEWVAIDTLTNDTIIGTDWGYINTFQGPADLLYKVWAKDANGCPAEDVDFIAAPKEVTFDVLDHTCYADVKASVIINADGEAGRKFKVLYKEILNDVAPATWTVYNQLSADTVFPYSLYINDAFLFDNEYLQDRHYAIKIIDELGCESAVDTVTFDAVQNDLILTATTSPSETCPVTINLAANGGIGPYVFTVDGEEVAGTSVEVGSGSHVVVLTDSHFCTDTVMVDVEGLTRETLVTTYFGEEVAFVDVPAGVDTMLAEGVYTFAYTTEEGCATVLTVTVEGVPYELSIPEVQSEQDTSAYVGKVVEVDGTVTNVVSGVGFYMQDASAAWSGIFVAAETTTGILVGNGVVVTGTVAEVLGVTTIVSTNVDLTTPVATITPVVVAAGEVADEMYESVLVMVEGGHAMSYDSTTSEWVILTDAEATVNDLFYSADVVLDHFYDVTGIVNGMDDAYTIEPRDEDDVVDITITGIVDPSNTIEFKVYPNPFNDRIIIDNNDKLTRIVVSNIAGQRVMDIEYPGHEIRTANLVSGVYLISLFTEEGITKTERIVKR